MFDSGLVVEMIAVFVYVVPADHHICTSKDIACPICQLINNELTVHVNVCPLIVGTGVAEFAMYVIPTGSVSVMVYHVEIHHQIFDGVSIKRTTHQTETFEIFDVLDIARSARGGVHVFVDTSHTGVDQLHCALVVHWTHLFDSEFVFIVDPEFVFIHIGLVVGHLLFIVVFSGPHSTQIH